MAFGTGTHPTTQLCLELLERSIGKQSAIIDVGCGSGILSIGGLKLGADFALGVDIDEASIKASRENADANDIAPERFAVGLGSVTEILNDKFLIKQAPLVIANILAPVIIRLFGLGLADLVAPGGALILSGILTEQAGTVQSTAQEYGMKVVEKCQMGDWVAFTCRC
jgi:ribosomal protein L11 methyltransferase